MSYNEITSVHVDNIGDVPVKSGYTDFVEDYTGDDCLPETDKGFQREFGHNLEDMLEGEGDTPENVSLYAASVGAREALETDQEYEDLQHLNSNAALHAVVEDRGPIPTVLSTFSPLGYGFTNPHRTTEGVSLDEMKTAIEAGFESYRDEQLP